MGWSWVIMFAAGGYGVLFCILHEEWLALSFAVVALMWMLYAYVVQLALDLLKAEVVRESAVVSDQLSELVGKFKSRPRYGDGPEDPQP